jgi:uncharacterized protein YoxC
MSILFLATLLQDTDMANSLHRMSTYMGVLGISAAVIALVLVIGGAIVAMQLMKAIEKVTALATDLQGRVNPLIQEATVISKHTREILEDAKPKIQTITDHLVTATESVRDITASGKVAASNVTGTVSDATQRAHKQVVRVDSMITTAINTTADVIESIQNGIRVPAQKIASVANQARFIAEGLFEKVKSMTGAGPFGASKGSTRSAPVPPPSGNRPGTPGAPTGSAGPREPVAVP